MIGCTGEGVAEPVELGLGGRIPPLWEVVSAASLVWAAETSVKGAALKGRAGKSGPLLAEAACRA